MSPLTFFKIPFIKDRVSISKGLLFDISSFTLSTKLLWFIKKTNRQTKRQSQKDCYLPSFMKWVSSVQLLSRVQLFATPWIAAHQASLSITNPRSSLRLTSIESVMPSSHLILCLPLLLLPPIPPSIRVFSNESTLRMRWPKYWSFSFSIIPSKDIPGLISLESYWNVNFRKMDG